jgi:hypothetical protein
MRAILHAVVSGLQKFFVAVAPAAGAVETLDPALGKSATLVNVLAGAKIGAALPWPEIEKVIAAKLSDPAADVQAAEDIAKTVAIVLPDAMYAADALAIVEALIQIGGALPPDWQIVKTTPSLPLGKDGVNPYSGAPVGV